MLTLRDAQIDAFRAATWQSFVREAGAALRRDLAPALAGLTEDEVARRVAWSLSRAQAQGMRHGTALVRLAACYLACGPRFDRHPAVAGLFAQPALAPEARLQTVLDSLPDRVWDELQMLAAAADWRSVMEVVRAAR